MKSNKKKFSANLAKNAIVCQLIHGLTATTQEMEALAEFLSNKGIKSVSTLLRGHGTNIEELYKTSWEDWYASVIHDFDLIRKEHENVYVIGLSVGALLALHLASQNKVNGIIALAPAMF
jgi:carboxylesterase